MALFTKRSLILILSVVLVSLFVLFVVPLPTKPSLYGYMQQRSIKKHLMTFKDPVFLPGGEFRPSGSTTSTYKGISFSTYSGWVDAYEIRYASESYLIQFTADSTLKSINGEGLSNAELGDLRQFAMGGTGCVVFDATSDIKYCKNNQYGYLIRTILHEGRSYYVAAMAFNGKSFKDTRTSDGFTPITNGIDHRILKSLSPVQVKDAEKYLRIDT